MSVDMAIPNMAAAPCGAGGGAVNASLKLTFYE
jgi:hypothetical protein